MLTLTLTHIYWFSYLNLRKKADKLISQNVELLLQTGSRWSYPFLWLEGKGIVFQERLNKWPAESTLPLSLHPPGGVTPGDSEEGVWGEGGADGCSVSSSRGAPWAAIPSVSSGFHGKRYSSREQSFPAPPPGPVTSHSLFSPSKHTSTLPCLHRQRRRPGHECRRRGEEFGVLEL